MGLKLVSPLRRAWVLCALSGCLAPLAPCAAATFPNLYQVTVAPDPAAPDQNTAATELALAKLLVRVTGSRTAAFDPELQALLRNPNVVNSRGTDLQGQTIVGFNASVVDAALSARNMPIWGAERPLTLLWIAVDDGVGGRALLGTNAAATEVSPSMAEILAGIRAELAAVSDERGLPLALPLLDLEDLTAVTFADVWGGFEDRVAAASARYRADAILIGRVRPGVLGSEVQWLLVKDGQRRLLDGLTLRDGLDAVADLYASEGSAVGAAATTRVSVLDVGSVADYGRVMRYLETLSVLQSIDVESLERGVLNLKVTARGDPQVLERVLMLGGVLSPAGGFGGPAVPGGSLSFRVNRGGGAGQ